MTHVLHLSLEILVEDSGQFDLVLCVQVSIEQVSPVPGDHALARKIDDICIAGCCFVNIINDNDNRSNNVDHIRIDDAHFIVDPVLDLE